MHDPVFDVAECGEGECESLIGDDEQLDDLQLHGMRILQKKSGFRFGVDAVLLADFARIAPRAHVVDFGTGTGVLPLLLHGRGKGVQFDAFELQADVAEMAVRTMRLNRLSERVRVHPIAVEDVHNVLAAGTVDAVVCNPPYGMPGTTLLNPSETLRLARHQQEGCLEGWFEEAYRLLRGKGRLSIIYPAPQMLQAMNALERAHLVPKRFRLVYPSVHKRARLVLIEAVRDARPMLHTEPPLILHRPNGEMTEELRRIYHLGGT